MKYWAFISYSHTDKRWGDWLHKALETYRVPRRLIGKEGRDGRIPDRIFPVFRDREELPVSSDLSTNINQALEESRYLIVICSPRSAQSRWVGQEIRTFKRMGREDRILALIVEGSPNASDGKPGVRPDEECFHHAMRHRWVDGDFSDVRTEPVAGDAREGRDGKGNARLKLVAGLLGVNYDELKQREHERRLRRARTIAAMAAILIAAFAALAVALFFKQREATKARDEAQLQSKHRLDLLREAAQSDHLRADEYFDRGEQPGGFAYLARSMRYDPSTTLAAEKMFAELNNWRFNPVTRVFADDTIVNKAHLSPNGTFVLTASNDRTVKIWPTGGGRPDILINEPDAPLTDAFFTVDGERIVTVVAGSGTKTPPLSDCYYNAKSVRVWERQTGKLLSTFRFSQPAKAVQVDDAGRHILAISEDGAARVWDIATSESLALLSGANTEDVKLSPDGERLIVQGCPGVCLTDSRGRTLRKSDQAQSAGFEADGRWISCYFPDHAELWDAHSGLVIGSVTIDSQNRSGRGAARFSQDAHLAIAVRKDGIARISAINGSAATVELKLAEDWDTEFARANASAEFSPDGTKVLSVLGDGQTCVWDASSGQLLVKLGGLVAHSATFSPDGTMILAFPDDNKIVNDLKMFELSAALYSAKTGQLLSKSQFPGPDLEFSSDGVSLLSVRDGVARLLRTTPLYNPPEFTVGGLDTVQFSIDGSKILTSGDSIRVWDLSTGAIVKTFSYPGHAQFCCDNRQIVAFGRDHVARAWDVLTGNLLYSFPISAEIGESPQVNDHLGRIVMVDDQRFVMRDLRTGELITSIELSASWERFHAVSLSSDGRQFLHRFYQSVELWDVETKERIRTLRHPARVGDARFSPDGMRVLTSCEDLIPRVWDAGTGQLLATMEPSTPPSQPASGLDYSPGGNYIFSTCDPPSLWNARTYEFVGHWEGYMRGFSSDESRMITEGQDYGDAVKAWLVRIWDTRTCTPTFDLRTKSGEVEAMSRDGTQVIISHVSSTPPDSKNNNRSDLVKNLRVWSILRTNADPPPSWVIDFLHYLAKKRLNAAGTLEPIALAEWLEIRQKLQALVRNNQSATDPYNQMLRRFMPVD